MEVATMKDCYELIHFLKDTKIDHLEPIDPTEYESPINTQKPTFKTITDNFEGTDSFQVIISNHNHIDPTKVSLNFSPLTTGKPYIKTIYAKDTVLANPMILEFELDDNVSPSDLSKDITGANSITIDFAKSITNLKIENIIAKSYDYNLPLSSIKKSYEDGYAYVIERLKNYDVYSDELIIKFKRFIYMASAAYAWLQQWEYETKPMKSDNIESNNYADRLFARVNAAINEYLASQGVDVNIHYIKDADLVKSSEMDWGVKEGNPCNLRCGWRLQYE